jgi:hypothetical protein
MKLRDNGIGIDPKHHNEVLKCFVPTNIQRFWPWFYIVKAVENLGGML